MNFRKFNRTTGYTSRFVLLIIITSITIIVNLFPLTLNYIPDHNLIITYDSLPSTLEHASCNSHNSRSAYTYHNYTTLVADLNQLNATYPNLLELFTTQEQYGLPDCRDGYKVWVARITNEELGFNKPEVLFIGGHHGNEDISIEAPYYLIEFLLENYASNETIRYLLDHREIYVMPVINPWGWENNKREDYNNEDVNRDYPYGIEAGNTPLTTVGARSVAELMKRHLFILSLTWHSGDHLIYYAWGTPKHNTPSDESPDDVAFFEVAKLMRDFAGGASKYPFGPANQEFYYAASGAWSDYAYAATWDTQHVFSGYETPGACSLALGIEISDTKAPAEAKLGKSEDVLNPGIDIGFIPQNIRMALVLIDLAEPHLIWQNINDNQAPIIVNSSSNITLNWTVHGSFSVSETKLLFGTDPDPIKYHEFETDKITGGSVWSGESFSQTFKAPKTPGDYYLVAHASVDQIALNQVSPEPNVLPQSFFVNQRTNDSWSVSNNGNTLNGKTDWFSPIIQIKVKGDLKNQIQITDFPARGYCKELINISWKIDTNQTVNNTVLFWGQNEDLRNYSEYMILPSGEIKSNGKNGSHIYYANFSLLDKPGNYYFIAYSKLDSEPINDPGNITELWSNIIHIEIMPRTPFTLDVSIPIIEYQNGCKQTLKLTGITCSNKTISNEPLNDSEMTKAELIIVGFNYESKEIIPEQEFQFQLSWSLSNNYWYLPILNISSWDVGWYLVYSKFEHKYGIGQSRDDVNNDTKNWFYLEHIITVKKPTLQMDMNKTYILNILEVTSWCSKKQIGYLDSNEAKNHSFKIFNLSNNKLVFNGMLNWSAENQSWYAINLNLSNLPPGDYFVICTFGIPEVGSGNSIHTQGDRSEFTLKTSFNNGPKKENDLDENNYILMALVIIFLIIILIFLIMFLRIRKK